MKRNIKLILEYEGTNYHGWQSQVTPQRDRPTIQETLEDALRKLTKEDVAAYSSGRTDAGVHALGQVVNFKTGSRIPAESFAPALNHFLPRDIRALSSGEVNQDFHSRHSAIGKIYKYLILNRSAPSALHRHFSWHVKRRLNLKNMRAAAAYLLGKRDFSAFRGSGCGAKTAVRTLKSLDIKKRGDFVEIWLEADAFLQYMARNIVGTLVEVGLGRFDPKDVRRMLISKDRTTAGRTAPAQGLYLVTVFYSVRESAAP